MAVSAHLKELNSKHLNLDTQIRTEEKSPLPDTMRLTALKKQKLLLKEQIAEFEAETTSKVG